VKSHGDLLIEDGVEDVVCLDIVRDSVEPLGVVVTNVDELLLMFEMESPQEFIVTPVIS
jgi:hypothetical protein